MKFNHPIDSCPIPYYTFNDLLAGDVFRSKEYADEDTYFIKTADSDKYFNAVCLEDGELCMIDPKYKVEFYTKEFDIYEEYFQDRD